MARADALGPGAPFVGRGDAQLVGRYVADETAVGRRAAGSPDWALIATVLTLTLLGLVFVFSSSFAVGQQLFDDPRHFALRQLQGAAMGSLAFLFFARIDYRRLRAFSPLIMIVAVLALMAVLVPGIGLEQNGARRWIQVGSAPPLQPSEFAKLAVVIYVAAWLASRGDAIQHVSLGLIPFSLIVGFLGFLLMAEPDLGTGITVTAIAGLMFFVAGAAIRHIAALGLLGGGVLFSIVAVAGYGMDRFTQFVSAEQDPEAGGFQVLQLLIALGSGGIRGVGLGESRQKFFYVPSAHTDGVFAIIGEEIGFIGAILVLLLFAFLAYRGIRIAQRAPDKFGTLLAVGIITWITLQAFFNIGGITRTIPLTGIPLPFVSFGSSALIATLAAAGLLVSVSRFTVGRLDDSGMAPSLKDFAMPPASHRDDGGTA
ncbi:MAG: cell division protein FtsW [Chloroflexi bacterium]|nr:MAG: cell division protein FtsW [Chloroflexota bacterium]